MRRRRDRLLKRKARMTKSLIEHGFFPEGEEERKALVTLNPYTLRAKGLDEALKPEEFARALFHINQRRGFKSNRKTDKKDNDSGALKQAISKLRTTMKEENCRTVGEWLYKRDHAGKTVRARLPLRNFCCSAQESSNSFCCSGVSNERISLTAISSPALSCSKRFVKRLSTCVPSSLGIKKQREFLTHADWLYLHLFL